MEEKKEHKIPDHVINTYVEKYGQYPCITQTRNVTVDAIHVLTKKNKMLWFYKVYNDEFYIKQTLIDYSSLYKIMIFVNSKENEKIYKLFILSSNDGGTNIDLLIKGLNKFYTIDNI
jgi:hypothetical protein